MKLKVPPGTTYLKTASKHYDVSEGYIEVDPDSPDLPYLQANGYEPYETQAAQSVPNENQPPTEEPDSPASHPSKKEKAS